MKAVGIVIGVLGIVFALAVLLTVPVWLLWNWLMPAVFGVAKVTLLQALGLNLLSSILFRSSGFRK